MVRWDSFKTNVMLSNKVSVKDLRMVHGSCLDSLHRLTHLIYEKDGSDAKERPPPSIVNSQLILCPMAHETVRVPETLVSPT